MSKKSNPRKSGSGSRSNKNKNRKSQSANLCKQLRKKLKTAVRVHGANSSQAIALRKRIIGAGGKV